MQAALLRRLTLRGSSAVSTCSTSGRLDSLRAAGFATKTGACPPAPRGGGEGRRRAPEGEERGETGGAGKSEREGGEARENGGGGPGESPHAEDGGGETKSGRARGCAVKIGLGLGLGYGLRRTTRAANGVLCVVEVCYRRRLLWDELARLLVEVFLSITLLFFLFLSFLSAHLAL